MVDFVELTTALHLCLVNGGLLICGRAGSGKTLLLEHLKKSTSQDPGWLLSKEHVVLM
jgi:ABC-type lipoprotein export system ATPase subunit